LEVSDGRFYILSNNDTVNRFYLAVIIPFFVSGIEMIFADSGYYSR